MSKFWIFNAIGLGMVGVAIGLVKNKRDAREFEQTRRKRRARKDDS